MILLFLVAFKMVFSGKTLGFLLNNSLKQI